MSNWRTTILENFLPGISRLTLVADPDSLLSEEKLSTCLRERGFDMLEFDDPIAFRYAYESGYRSLWDAGETTDLVVILRLRDSELGKLPYDLLKAGRALAFDLGGLFPHLSYPVIEQLDQKHLDALFDAQERFSPDPLGDNATKDFILAHVFGIASEVIKDDVELLRKLLRLHYGGAELPESLCSRLVHVLRLDRAFHDWPLEEIVPKRAAFFSFLEERWPSYLARLAEAGECNGETNDAEFQFPGPGVLPFGHDDIRVYIDNLFVEGKLRPTRVESLPDGFPGWARSGVILENDEDASRRIRRLFEAVEATLPKIESGHAEWLAFAAKWGELSSLLCGTAWDEHVERWRELGTNVDAEFQSWLALHYASMMTLPPQSPAMLHQVPRRLARDIEQSMEAKVALVVIDGLAFAQWVVARNVIHEQDESLLMDEGATFAWIPTTTSVSRQSVFAGKPPLYFPDSIGTTSGEPELWQQFWHGIGLSRREIAYRKGLGGGDVESALEPFDLNTTRALGLVVDKVDKIMHGMQLGAAGMLNQVRQWMEAGYLTGLIQRLCDSGFSVWLTSDHGNVECFGSGRPAEGVVAETRGERVRIYSSVGLREKTACSHAKSIPWLPVGLPDDYFPLLAGERTAFVSERETIVAHGGSSIEEVIVPLVSIQRRGQ